MLCTLNLRCIIHESKLNYLQKSRIIQTRLLSYKQVEQKLYDKIYQTDIYSFENLNIQLVLVG